MKRIMKSAKVLLAVIMVVALTGCYKVEVRNEIRKDKTVDFSVIYAVDEEQMASLGDQGGDVGDYKIDESEFEDAKEQGYIVEKYEETTEDHHYTGVKLTKTFGNIDELVTDSEEKISLLGMDDKELNPKGMFKKSGDIYKSNFTIDFSSEGDGTGMDQQANAAASQILKAKYTVVLPNESKSNNATSVSEDKKTLSWNLEYGKNNVIDYEFELASPKEEKNNGSKKNSSTKSDNNIVVYAAIGCAFLVVTIIVITIALKPKKQEEAK